jgi:hypothetical protein
MASQANIPRESRLLQASDPAFVVVYLSHALLFGPPNSWIQCAAVELATGQMIVDNTPALDVFGSHYVAEVRPGVVGLYERSKGLEVSVVLYNK